MTITVDIADRLYDYTDEECAADAIAEYQAQTGLDDSAIIALWRDERDPKYKDLYGRVVNAVDANGSVKRARDSIPAEITLAIV